MQRIALPALVCLCLASAGQVLGVGLPAGTTIEVTATANYTDSQNQSRTAEPARAIMTVMRVAGIAIDVDEPPTETAGGETVYVPLRITNTGNATDVAELSIRSSSGWSVAYVYDDNADGIHQPTEQWVITNTGAMVADGYCPCFARVVVPPDAAAGDTVTLTATSAVNAAQGQAVAEFDLPAPGKEATALTAEFAPASPFAGQAVTVSGAIAPAMAAQLSVLITDPSGGQVTSSVLTQADGAFTTAFTPQRAGAYTITISFAGSDAYAASSATLTAQVQKTPTSIVLVAAPEAPVIADELTVTGLITPAVQAEVQILRTDPTGGQTQAQTSSGVDGTFTYTTTVSAMGAWRISAAYAGSDTFASCSRELSIYVSEAVPGEHTVAITSGPTVTPSVVDSGGTAQCAVTAVDSRQHEVRFAWSDGGAGGSFSPNAGSRSPVYTAPSNKTGVDRAVTLTCTATCASDPAVTASASAVLVVRTAPIVPPSVVAVAPQDGSGCVSNGSTIVVLFDRAMNRQATQPALRFTPPLVSPSYSWSADNKSVTVAHAGFAGNTTYLATVTAGAKDTNGVNIAAPYEWTFTTTSWAHFERADAGARPGEAFATPAILLNDPSKPDMVTLTIGVPEGFDVDTAMAGSSLACVTPGDGAGIFASAWDPVARQITISAEIPAPADSVEVVKSITFTAPANGYYTFLLNGCTGLGVRVGAIPGDFNYDEAVNITDASLFIGAWVRWHQPSPTSFDPVADAPFDLAPRTAGEWPDWSPIGDRAIAINDATSFIECWVGAHAPGSTAASIGAGSGVESASEEMTIVINDAVDGSFELSVPVPADAAFDAAVDGSGNLMNVWPGTGVGGLFFSEYDVPSHSIRLAGQPAGSAPYVVAIIRLSRAR